MNAAIALWILLAAGPASIPPPASELERELGRAEQAIEHWDVVTAGAIAARLRARLPDAPETAILEARVRFLEGEYEASASVLRALEEKALAPDVASEVGEFRRFVEPLAKIAAGFAVAESAHFRLHYARGVDRVLVERGLETLEACYGALAESYGIRPEAKIRVEVFPDADSFQKASTLTRNEIETSGTIALCKFNRLMMITPRVVIRGFGWADTLCHEYAHYVLWKRNGSTIPIWLHEAIAKYEEVRWSGSKGSELTPDMKEALKLALEDGEFVTFEQMHPSFAKLKTPREVGLASAEVLSIIRALMARGGYPLLDRMLDALKAGADWRQMFEQALGEPFESFWKEWQQRTAIELAEVKPRRPAEGKRVELRDPMRKPEPPGAEPKAAAGGAEARDEDEGGRLSGRHARLGDLLRGRGRYRAAAIEYDKAARAGGDDSPVLWNRLGLTWREAGEIDAARAAFLKAEERNPEYAPTLTNLGLLERGAGDARASAGWLERAARVNPYDPRIHQALAEVYGVLGNAALRARAEQELEVLGTR